MSASDWTKATPRETHSRGVYDARWHARVRASLTGLAGQREASVDELRSRTGAGVETRALRR